MDSTLPTLPPNKNLEFPPLSQMPRVECQMPLNNPVDQFVPEKFTQTQGLDDASKLKKDLSQCIPKTVDIITTGTKQVKHVKAITLELKLLLEHEQKILQQVITRIDKFKYLRDENKRKATEWENEYKAKIPEYESYSTKLVNVPQSKPITVEGLPAPIQQKILYQIVSRTSNTADRVVVSLSMEQTVANDIDLTLGGLKKHCTVILKRIRGWLKMLDTHECQQNVVLERWDKYKNNIKEMKNHIEERTMTAIGSAPNLAHQLKPYDDRIKRLEEAICKMGGPTYGTCPKGDGKRPVNSSEDKQQRGSSPTGTRGPGEKTVLKSKEDRLKRIEAALCHLAGPATGFCSQSASPSQLPREDRLKRIEAAICKVAGPTYGTCPTGAAAPGTTSAGIGIVPLQRQDRNRGPETTRSPLTGGQLTPDELRLKKIEEAMCKLYGVGCGASPTIQPNQQGGACPQQPPDCYPTYQVQPPGGPCVPNPVQPPQDCYPQQPAQCVDPYYNASASYGMQCAPPATSTKRKF